MHGLNTQITMAFCRLGEAKAEKERVERLMSLRTRFRIGYKRTVLAGLIAATVAVAPLAVFAAATWHAKPSPTALTLKGVKLVNSCIAYAVAENDETLTNQRALILKSTNGGATWVNKAPTNLVDTTFNKVDAINGLPAIVVVGEPTDVSNNQNTPGHGRVVVSQNGGTSWADDTGNLPILLNPVTDIEDLEGVSLKPGSSQSWMIAASIFDGASYGRIYRTTNGGLSYTTVYELAGDGIGDVYWADALHAWFVTDSGKIYLTANGGNSWALQFDTTTNLERVKFFDVAHGAVVGDFGAEFYTNDGGASWHAGTTFTTDDLKDLAWRDASSLFVVGDPDSNQAFPFIGVSTDGGKTFATEPSPVVAELNSISLIKGTVPAQALAVGSEGTVIKRGTFCGN
jgi:photosystem II stability/assembly factor-like uncharacterized protein